eukprot:GFYU01022621.1.p1 GENE.GFYU01022621.1~~GFYU01022621.1.p1  ORF type:complete len:114 (-),score=38.95 GFYU01022621.1:33-374(-)
MRQRYVPAVVEASSVGCVEWLVLLCIRCDSLIDTNHRFGANRNDGLFIGTSSGFNLVGAVKLARKLGPGKTVVTVLCDSGERYQSKIYNDEWLKKYKYTKLPPKSGDNLEFVK